MQCLLRTAVVALVPVMLGVNGSVSAFAQTGPIGATSLVERDVSGVLGSRTRVLTPGDDVFSNELIRTANLSATKIVFVDESNLSLGPLAAIKLDRFVFNPDKTAKSAVINMTLGAFRWVSGFSSSRAYEVRTPLANIGVRGTVFDVLVETRRVVVMLHDGALVVCPTGSRQCTSMSRPGQVVTVTPGRVHGPTTGGPSRSNFASSCLSAGDRSRCKIATASLADAPSQPKRALAGRKYSNVNAHYNPRRPVVTRRPQVIAVEPYYIPRRPRVEFGIGGFVPGGYGGHDHGGHGGGYGGSDFGHGGHGGGGGGRH